MKSRVVKLATTFLLAVAILVACVSFASAAEIGGTCGENLRWSFNEATGELVISGTGEMDGYEGADIVYPSEETMGSAPDSNDEKACINYADKMVGNMVIRETDLPWGEYLGQIKKITINEGVTSIGQSAFIMCSNLVEVNLPNSLTEIGNGAFIYCINLKEINIPDGMVEIENAVFAYCVRLEKINIPRSIENLGETVFEGCVSLKSIELPKTNAKLHAANFGYEIIGIKDIYFEGSEEEFAEIFSQMDISDGGYSTVEEAFKDAYGISVHYNSKITPQGNAAEKGDNTAENTTGADKAAEENKDETDEDSKNSDLIVILLIVAIVLIVILIAVVIVVSLKKKPKEYK